MCHSSTCLQPRLAPGKNGLRIAVESDAAPSGNIHRQNRRFRGVDGAQNDQLHLLVGIEFDADSSRDIFLYENVRHVAPVNHEPQGDIAGLDLPEYKIRIIPAAVLLEFQGRSRRFQFVGP